MHSQLKIAIDQPCKENFNDFEARPEGGFCQSCQTTVVDFTKMSDQEIRDYFLGRSQKVCGRFKQSQLDRPINNAPSASSNWFKRISVLGIPFLALLPFSDLKAQIKPKPFPVEQRAENAETKSDSSRQNTFYHGQVLDAQTGETIPFANIYNLHRRIGTTSDIDGKFVLKSNELKAGDTLEISFVGYQKKAIVLQEQKDLMIKMELSTEVLGGPVVIMGEVATSEVLESKHSLWDRFKALFQ